MIEYIREKHYSVALIRIKELEQQRDKLLDALKKSNKYLVSYDETNILLNHDNDKLIAECETK